MRKIITYLQNLSFVLIIVIVCFDANAQELVFEHYDSLRNSCINSILVNDNNEKIIATSDSICIVKSPKKDTKLMYSLGAYSIYRNSLGDFWFGLVDNNLYDFSTNNGCPLTDNPNNTLNSIVVTQNFVYAGTADGLIQIERDQKTGMFLLHKKIVYSSKKYLNGGRVNVVFEDSRRIKWIGTDKGLYRMNKKENKPIREGDDDEIRVSAMKEGNGSLWIAGSDGVWQYKNYEKWVRPGRFRDFRNHRIEAIAFDQKDRIWLAGKEIICCDETECRTYSKEHGFTSIHPLCMAVDNDDVLWIGTSGKGLFSVALSEKKPPIVASVDLPKSKKRTPPKKTSPAKRPPRKKAQPYKARYEYMEGYAHNNIIILVDISNSMGDDYKLPRLTESVKSIVNKMRPEDYISIITFTRRGEVVLPKTSCIENDLIFETLDSLKTGGGSRLESGIEKAYFSALESFEPNSNNRIIIATDGLFTISDDIYKMVKKRYKSDISLSVLNFGKANNERLVKLSEKGGGNYHRISTVDENLFKKLEIEVKSKREY